MGKLKKIVGFLLCGLMTACFAGCGFLISSGDSGSDSNSDIEQSGSIGDSCFDGNEIQLIGDEVFMYDDSGNRVEANNLFVKIENDTYYAVANKILTGKQIIRKNVYDFGEDGKMLVGTHGEYTYDESGKLVGTNIFITINNNIYYIVGGKVATDKQVIDGYVYDFGEDGKMLIGTHGEYTYDESGKLVGTNIFVTINNNIYYIVDGETVKSCYKIIEKHVYYFDSEGKRQGVAENDHYEIGTDGYLLGDFCEIKIEGKDYFIIDDIAYEAKALSGTVYESDNDYDLSNNTKLANVTCEAWIDDHVLTAATNDSGAFAFERIPAIELTLKFSLANYITTQIALDCAQIDENEIAVVMDRQVSNALKGKIVVADSDLDPSNNTPMSGAKVTLVRENGDEYSNSYSMETYSDSTGAYTFSGMTAGIYKLVVEKEGYITISQTVQVRYNETTYQNLQLEAIPEADEEQEGGYASGVIKDARTGLVITCGLKVYIRNGVNNFIGDSICVVTTDSNGKYTTPELPAGNYTAYVVDERATSDLPDQNEDYRYGSQAISVKVLSGKTIDGQGATISNSVGFDGTGVRIVLTWGASPSDLDSHLTFGSSHVYYNNKKVGDCSLDVDDTSAYGPETITIESVGSYQYNYYVYNYSKRGTFQAASAVVNVYFGNALAYTFNAPSGSGFAWNVFTIDGTTGELTVTNTISQY